MSCADGDEDGLVSASDVHSSFVGSGLGKAVLNHVWALADSQRTRKLDVESFCIAMHLLECAKKGLQLPDQLDRSACLPPPIVEETPTEDTVVMHQAIRRVASKSTFDATDSCMIILASL